MTCSRSRRAVSKDSAPTTPAASLAPGRSDHRQERIYVDKADPEVAHDEVTVIDHAADAALDRHEELPTGGGSAAYWREISCFENNDHVEIGKEPYMLSADRKLMPTKKDQPPPDLKYFKRTQKVRRTTMLARTLLCVTAAAALSAATAGAQIIDYSKYPDLTGQWRPIGGPGRFDMTKPAGRGQLAPLTAEYQAIFEANLKDQAAGGQGTTSTYKCLSPGMPRVTNAYGETEFLITPDTTYILIDHILDDRRIFTDGRDWPADLEPSLLGYSIGKWIDSKGDGHYDVLEVETRGFRGPRAFDGSGLPCTKTIKQSSRSASSSTRRIPRSPTTRSRSSTMR